MKTNIDEQNAIGEKSENKDCYDIVIIGAGPAGLSAAIYTKRKGLSTLVIAEKVGGQVSDTTSVENYAGFTSISGSQLAHNFRDHAESLNVAIKEFVRVTAIRSENERHIIALDDDSDIIAKAVIIATGSKPRKLGVPGEDEYYGRGVAYCAICDGPLFEGRDVIVAGGGNSAVEAAIDLAKIANTVKIVHRSQFRADQILLEQLAKYDNVSVHLQTQIKAIHGDKLVTGIKAFDKDVEQEVDFAASGIFVEIGYLPNSEWLDGVVALNKRGEVITNSVGATNVPGIFAAGDITDVAYKQIIISAGEGAMAALSANDYVNKL